MACTRGQQGQGVRVKCDGVRARRGLPALRCAWRWAALRSPTTATAPEGAPGASSRWVKGGWRACLRDSDQS